jgi:phosphate transport system substrate-binding protein
MQAWIDEYTRLHPGIHINYQSIGSGGGIRQITAKNIFFAASDGPMTDEQLAKAGRRILHLPVTLHAVVPAYNLPQVPEMRFSGSTLAGIFLGRITKWNDPAITSDNPGVDLPRMDIKVVHNFPNTSEGAYIMAGFLSKISPEFKTTYATSTRQTWPVPSGMAGCHGGGGCTVAGVVRQSLGAVGCIELMFARYNQIQYGAVENSEGEFVTASSESVTAAAAANVPLIQTQAPDFRVSITNPPGRASYPIAAFIWVILYENPEEKDKNAVMIDFLKWALTDGQKLAPKLGYAPLPRDLIKIELDRLAVPAH